MNFKKRVNGSWVDTPNYIHNTSTDTITTLPAVLYPNAATATVGLKGNTVQSTTPTPDNPIMPQGTGERTENLYNGQYMFAYIDSTGKIIENAANVLAYAEVEPNTTYTVSADLMATNGNRIAVFNATPTANLTGSNVIVISQRAYLFTITTNNDTKYIAWHTNFSDNNRLSQFLLTSMLNTGSTPLPYEPYGIKIPISSANTTTPVYLGEVQTTRKVKKLVLDGTEDWTISSAWKKTNTSVFYFAVSGIGGTSDNERYILSTHFAPKSRTELYRGDIEGIGKTGGNSVTVRVDDTIATTVNDFKAWLRDNNVTIWYVLATEETGTVNEPLMKIGDYADTLSNISIPVTAGGDTISVDTTVQPSEATVNYKGWHPVADVHERENGAWD